MESLAVGLLLFVIGSLWGIGVVIFGWLYKMDKKLGTVCRDGKSNGKRISQVEDSIDDHEGRICTLEGSVIGGEA